MRDFPKITLRIAASEYSLKVTEGETTTNFDLSKLRRAAKRKLRRMTVGALEAAGYFSSPALAPA